MNGKSMENNRTLTFQSFTNWITGDFSKGTFQLSVKKCLKCFSRQKTEKIELCWVTGCFKV